jgi:hypothetical protein
VVNDADDIHGCCDSFSLQYGSGNIAVARHIPFGVLMSWYSRHALACWRRTIHRFRLHAEAIQQVTFK